MTQQPKLEPVEHTLQPLPVTPEPELDPLASAKEKKDALKTITDFRRATAWQLHRWPLTTYTVEEKTKVHLPRAYLEKGGEDVKVVWEGSDLNQFVYKWYNEVVDLHGTQLTVHARNSKEKVDIGEGEDTGHAGDAANFVSGDSISARRHEYLGPDPRIAGYHFDIDGEVHIKWWDGFLQDQWMGKQKWKFEVILNDEGKWVEKDS